MSFNCTSIRANEIQKLNYIRYIVAINLNFMNIIKHCFIIYVAYIEFQTLFSLRIYTSVHKEFSLFIWIWYIDMSTIYFL